ncbi:MAG: 3-deoxy-manno-octulosonate cytidylyltransferase [Caldimonas sp.]
MTDLRRPAVAKPAELRSDTLLFDVLIPARLASTRLPGKPLADLGGLPMVVRVAQRAALSAARRVVVAGDHPDIVSACVANGVAAVLTRDTHVSGSDRLAEACELLGLAGDDMVVNVQGDEPLIEPSLIDGCAQLLARRTDCVMSTAAHPIASAAEFADPNVVKVVLDAQSRALYFSRAGIPHRRDRPSSDHLAAPTTALRHVGLYAYRAGFLRSFPLLPQSPLEAIEALEQLRVLWNGERIAVHITATAPGIGVDTPEDLARARAMFA